MAVARPTSCRLLSDRRPLLAKASYKKVSNHSVACPGSPGKAAPQGNTAHKAGHTNRDGFPTWRCAPNRATVSFSPSTHFFISPVVTEPPSSCSSLTTLSLCINTQHSTHLKHSTVHPTTIHPGSSPWSSPRIPLPTPLQLVRS